VPDVLVIGGGPAGAACALRLARAGCSVAVLEKTRFPRGKVCGEFIAPSGVAELRSLGIDLDGLRARQIRRLALWTDDATLEAPLPSPARSLAREKLDCLLLERAVACGASVYQPAAAHDLQRTAEGFVCTASAPHGGARVEIAARVVVAAHGSWLTGALPTQAPRTRADAADLFGFKAHFSGCELAGEIALVPFDGGYGGALDLGGGRGTFACCVRRDRIGALRAARPQSPAGEAIFRAALERAPALRAALGHARRDGAWLAAGPLRPGMRGVYRDGVFAIGNAAGEVHPMIGEGISLALRSARLLSAELIPALDAGWSSARVARSYARAWRRTFLPTLLAARAFAAIAMRPRAAAMAGTLLGRAPRLITFAAAIAR
jgi:flavin-dependent dehydrogenase